MGTVANIISLARNQFNIASSVISDNQLLIYLNNVYHENENELVDEVGEDYYIISQFANLVAYQQSYSFPISGSNTANGFKKSKGIFVKYNTNNSTSTNTITATGGTNTATYSGTTISDEIKPGYLINVTDNSSVIEEVYVISIDTVTNTFIIAGTWTNNITTKLFIYKTGNWTKLDPITLSSSDYDLSEYNNNINSSGIINNGFYRLLNDTFEIYPRGTNNITFGIRLEYAVDNIDLGLLGLETDIKIPRQFQNILALGMGPWIYQYQSLFDKKAQAENSYQQKKKLMLENLQDRDLTPNIGSLPPLTHLE